MLVKEDIYLVTEVSRNLFIIGNEICPQLLYPTDRPIIDRFVYLVYTNVLKNNFIFYKSKVPMIN